MYVLYAHSWQMGTTVLRRALPDFVQTATANNSVYFRHHDDDHC